jgi:hypothetical protein
MTLGSSRKKRAAYPSSPDGIFLIYQILYGWSIFDFSNTETRANPRHSTAIFAHPPKTENLPQTLARRALQRQLTAENG